jgi:hypothetical protein
MQLVRFERAQPDPNEILGGAAKPVLFMGRNELDRPCTTSALPKSPLRQISRPSSSGRVKIKELDEPNPHQTNGCIGVGARVGAWSSPVEGIRGGRQAVAPDGATPDS